MTFFTWQTDPLLYDKHPIPANAWLTANQLIEQGQLERIFYDRVALKLELYPILVRKIDFVRKRTGDRVLARFPFKVLTAEEKALLQRKGLLLAEFLHHYFYRSLDDSIRSWRDKLRHYLERGAMPFPLLRCLWEITPTLVHYPQGSVVFESARGKRYTIPCQISNRLAYLCGVVNGDGHLQKYWLSIVDASKEHIQFLSKLIECLFGERGNLSQIENAWTIELRSSAAVRLFNFLTDQTIAGVKYTSLREPLLFQTLGLSYRSLYWRGVMDADGSYTNQISFTSKSKSFVQDFQQFLAEAKIPSKLFETKLKAFMLLIPAKHTVALATLLGVSNPKKQADFYRLLQRKRYSSQFKGVKTATLTPDGYFNLLLLAGLEVVGLETLLTTFRAGRSYYKMRDLFSIYQGSYSKYEKGEHAIPLSLVSKIVEYSSGAKKSLMAFLAEHPHKLFFKSATSNLLTLPLKPNPTLLQILPLLDPRETYINILNNYTELLEPFYRQFHVVLNGPRLHNRLIAHFLKTFFNYTLTNAKMSPVDFSTLRKEWEKHLQG